jgi:hypothetical protein
MKTPIEYLDEIIPALKAESPKPPDCWIIYKTTPPHGQVVGPPLAIYRYEESLRAKFPALVESLDTKWGIDVGCWWYDD